MYERISAFTRKNWNNLTTAEVRPGTIAVVLAAGPGQRGVAVGPRALPAAAVDGAAHALALLARVERVGKRLAVHQHAVLKNAVWKGCRQNTAGFFFPTPKSLTHWI